MSTVLQDGAGANHEKLFVKSLAITRCISYKNIKIQESNGFIPKLYIQKKIKKSKRKQLPTVGEGSVIM